MYHRSAGFILGISFASSRLPYSIPVSWIIQIGEGAITVIVNRAETSISFEPAKEEVGRLSLGKGRTLFDVILETAVEVA